MKKIILIFISTILAYLGTSADEYHVYKKGANKVRFISDAPLEDFDGVTKKIDGFLLTKTDGYEDADLYFEVDLNDLDTGIGLRDRHMRDNYLMTEDHPYAKFDGKIVSAKKNSNGSYSVTVEGDMEVKGKKHKQKINGTISGLGSKIDIKTDFIVNLTDHNIEVPSLMGAKISEDIELEVFFTMKRVD